MGELVQLGNLKGLEIEEVKQFENLERDRPQFDNRYLKMFYFAWKEGLISTYRKLRAHRQEQRRYLTIVFVSSSGKSFVNISTQSQKDPGDFVLVNEFHPFKEPFPDTIERDPDYYLEAFNQFAGTDMYEQLGISTKDAVSFQLKDVEILEEAEEGLFVYGLGGYVKMFIIQHFRKFPKIACVDYKAKVSKSFRERYGFRHHFLVPDDSLSLLKKVKRPVVIIATYHSDHASLARKVYDANPQAQIFVEKPPAVTLEDLKDLLELYSRGASLEIGFNRRFIGFNRKIQKLVKGKVLMITCSVKEVVISDNHWYFWQNQGTRVTGNGVHWIDLASYWINEDPMEVNVLANPEDPDDVAITVLYRNGSLLNICASAKGNSMRGVQESIEIRYDNETISINDYNSMVHIKKNGFRRKKSKLRRKKGHEEMYRNFYRIIREKGRSEYGYEDLIRTTVVTNCASRMVTEGIKNMKVDGLVADYQNFFKRPVAQSQ